MRLKPTAIETLLIATALTAALTYAPKSKAVLPLLIPVVAAAELIGSATLTDGLLVGSLFVGAAILGKASNGIQLGSLINDVKLWTTGPATGAPDVVVNLDPKAVPISAPSNWAFDLASGLTFDPAVNVSSFTPSANPNCLYNGAAITSANPAQMICANMFHDLVNLVLYSSSEFKNGTLYCGTWFSFLGQYGPDQLGAYGIVAPSSGAALPSLNPAAPPMWPSDGHCTVQRVGNEFSGNPQDPDCFISGNPANGPKSLPPGVSQNGGTITANNGNGSSTTITINPDGTVTIGTRAPNAAGTATIANTFNISAPAGTNAPSTVLTGQTTTVYNGTGTGTSTTPVIPVTGVGSPGSAGANGTNGTNGQDAPDLCVTHPNIEACQVISPGAAAGTDGLYNGQTGVPTTFGEVLSSFTTKVQGSAVWTSTVGFFRYTEVAGSCSGLSTTFTLFTTPTTVDLAPVLCGTQAEYVWSIIAIGLFISFTVAAFYIAIL